MSQTIVSPPLSHTLRRSLARMWEDPDSRGILIGLLAVVMVHLLLFLIGPFLLRSDPISTVARPHAAPRQFSIELAPDTFVPKTPPKPPMKFVETNPNAPDNVPDKTNNFAAQNQQVAQEKPTPDGKNDRPAIEGQKEIKSSQIVDGRLTKPVEQTPIAPSPDVHTKEESNVQTTRAEQNPLPGFDKKISDDSSAFGSNIAKFTENAKNIPERIDGAKNVPLIQGTTAAPTIDPHRPRPRPQITKTQQVRPAIFEENKFGTANVGIIGVSAQFSKYGLYLQKLTETVQIQWDSILAESRIYPPSGSTVVVTFILNSEGKISRIVNVESKATEPAARACTSAITDRAPYGPWSDDMKAMLGEEQELVFSFYYQ